MPLKPWLCLVLSSGTTDFDAQPRTIRISSCRRMTSFEGPAIAAGMLYSPPSASLTSLLVVKSKTDLLSCER